MRTKKILSFLLAFSLMVGMIFVVPMESQAAISANQRIKKAKDRLNSAIVAHDGAEEKEVKARKDLDKKQKNYNAAKSKEGQTKKEKNDAYQDYYWKAYEEKVRKEQQDNFKKARQDYEKANENYQNSLSSDPKTFNGAGKEKDKAFKNLEQAYSYLGSYGEANDKPNAKKTVVVGKGEDKGSLSPKFNQQLTPDVLDAAEETMDVKLLHYQNDRRNAKKDFEVSVDNHKLAEERAKTAATLLGYWQGRYAAAEKNLDKETDNLNEAKLDYLKTQVEVDQQYNARFYPRREDGLVLTNKDGLHSIGQRISRNNEALVLDDSDKNTASSAYDMAWTSGEPGVENDGSLSFDSNGELNYNYNKLSGEETLQANGFPNQHTNDFSGMNGVSNNNPSANKRLTEYQNSTKTEPNTPVGKSDIDNFFDQKYGDLIDKKPGSSGKTPIYNVDDEVSGGQPYKDETNSTFTNINEVCGGIKYTPSEWEFLTKEEYKIEGVYAYKINVTPVTPINLSLMNESQIIEWRRTHRPQNSLTFLSEFGKELKKIQNEGLIEKIKNTKDSAEAIKMFEQMKERLENAKAQDDLKQEDRNVSINLSEENKKGLARGGVFTITQDMQYITINFGNKAKQRHHFTCVPVLDRVEERSGQTRSIYKPAKVIEKTEGPVVDPEESLIEITAGSWRPMFSYQIISARCSEFLDTEVKRTNGEMFQVDPFVASGKSGIVEGKVADFYNHLSIRFFYSGDGCAVNLRAQSDRPREKISNRIKVFRDGQKHKIEFDPFRPIKKVESSFLNIPHNAIYSEVAKWNRSTPTELQLYADGSSILLTKERQQQMTGEKQGFEISSEWASEQNKPTKFMFLYDYLADTTMKVPASINGREIKSFDNEGATLVLSVPVSSESRQHETVNVLNLPKDLVPTTREFMNIAEDQHFTIEVVKSGSAY